ncbi:MAG: carboxypeptidase-like regulatory domain-containing protein [Taibaiella sp.]|nr:carboxypeptidase-like regulatory domain-containing protein [Taibaiella sp.]
MENTFITGGLTDEEGIFSFELKEGEYWLTIEYLGMDTDTFDFIMPSEKLRSGHPEIRKGHPGS